MRKKNVLLWLLFFVVTNSVFGQYHLILMSGQSNMQGLGSKKEIEDFEFPSNIVYINFGYKGANFEIDNEHIGPEIGLAVRLNEVYPNEKFILLKFAAGGASLLDFHPNYDREMAKITQTEKFDHLYLKMIQKFDSVMNAYHCVPEVMLWMQGERDAKFIDAAKMYEKNLQYFVYSVRQQMNNLSLPFVLGKVNPPKDTYFGLQRVRNAQENLPSAVSNTFVVDTDDLLKNNDQLHYSAQGQLELGRRFAEIIIKNQLIHINSKDE